VVTFEDNSVTLATNPVNAAGQAIFRTAALGVGTHSIVATYRGDRNFLTSSSTAVTLVVNPDSTVTALKSSLNPSVVGQGVTFTGSVFAKGPGSGTPTGSVTFKDGGIVLGTGTLSSAGQATFSTASLAMGGHAITAVYGGDGDFTTSTSPVFGQGVHASATALATPFAEPPSATQPTVSSRPGSTEASPSVDVWRGALARLSPTSLDHFFLSLPSSDLIPRLVATRRREADTTKDWLDRLF
jgi:Bacterial Ig-like domain (group 3)